MERAAEKQRVESTAVIPSSIPQGYNSLLRFKEEVLEESAVTAELRFVQDEAGRPMAVLPDRHLAEGADLVTAGG